MVFTQILYLEFNQTELRGHNDLRSSKSTVPKRRLSVKEPWFLP